MTMEFILASNNKKKLREMEQILSREGCTVISMGDAGIESAPEETGATFEENAWIKAKEEERKGRTNHAEY